MEIQKDHLTNKKKLDKDTLELYYFRVVDIWKRLCELHSQLFDLTCDEYEALLESRVDDLEKVITKKEETIEKVEIVEDLRSKVILEINFHFANNQISKASDLLEFMSAYEKESNSELLTNLNKLLVDMIETIQAQNRKNQLFLNKALLSLKDMMSDITGNKYVTYDKSGDTSASRARK